jgi:hypothetical protein
MMLPVLGGISGSYKITLNMKKMARRLVSTGKNG